MASIQISSPEIVRQNTPAPEYEDLDCTSVPEITMRSGLVAQKKQCAALDGENVTYVFNKNGRKYELVRNKESNIEKEFDEMANSFRFTK